MLMRPIGSYQIDNLPFLIRRDIVCKYLYKDIVEGYSRIFLNQNTRVLRENQSRNEKFIYCCIQGLLPRFFDAENDNDKMIYNE